MSRAIHTYYEDENGICIIRDIYARRQPECTICGLREVCKHDLTLDAIERVIDRIDRQSARGEFWENYGADLFDEYGEV